MPETTATGRRGERGSALIIAVLISVILALLGISFLLMGETESRIAHNEKRSAQALYVAEAGARAAKRWFDRPGTAVRFPPSAVVARSQRLVLDENDPNDPADVTPADGVIGSYPYYKQGVDLDSDGQDDLFDRPYRPGLLHALMGTADGPDLRIDDADAGAKVFLEDLTRTLVGEFPGEGGGVRAAISRIDVYAPPYVPFGAAWSRYGLATVKVIARLLEPDSSGGERTVAEREVVAVLGEAPYRGPTGPLHSCGPLTFTNNGGLTVHWGVMTAVGKAKLSLESPSSNEPLKLPPSLPREEPSAPRVDPLWTGIDAAAFDAFRDAIDGMPVDVGWDPWFRIMSGDTMLGAPGAVLPWPSSPAPPPGGAPADCCDHSGIAQNVPLVACPAYDYEVWKLIATSGESDVRYFRWSGGFRENGTGPAQSFTSITDGEEGLFFFDTADAQPPADDDGDGFFDNLTPAITVSSPNWHFRGFVFLNAEEFKLNSAPSQTTAFRPPGEPFQDADLDGEYDPGEEYINLDYPTTLAGTGDPDKTDTFGGSVMRNDRGQPITGPVSMEGILFTSGEFEATGTGVVYGTVIARQGVVQTVADGSLPTPDLYWDESIALDWPPAGWSLPRTAITSWKTRR